MGSQPVPGRLRAVAVTWCGRLFSLLLIKDRPARYIEPENATDPGSLGFAAGQGQGTGVDIDDRRGVDPRHRPSGHGRAVDSDEADERAAAVLLGYANQLEALHDVLD